MLRFYNLHLNSCLFTGFSNRSLSHVISRSKRHTVFFNLLNSQSRPQSCSRDIEDGMQGADGWQPKSPHQHLAGETSLLGVTRSPTTVCLGPRDIKRDGNINRDNSETITLNIELGQGLIQPRSSSRWGNGRSRAQRYSPRWGNGRSRARRFSPRRGNGHGGPQRLSLRWGNG